MSAAQLIFLPNCGKHIAKTLFDRRIYIQATSLLQPNLFSAHTPPPVLSLSGHSSLGDLRAAQSHKNGLSNPSNFSFLLPMEISPDLRGSGAYGNYDPEGDVCCGV
jgi:hypothetical protein